MTYSELLRLDQQAPHTPRTMRSAIKTSIQRDGKPSRRHAAAHAIRLPPHHDGTLTSEPAIMPSPLHATTPSDAIARVRQAVLRVGREAVTHRLTRDERETLAEIAYQNVRQGVRTTANEIARIALNWLLDDYRAQGEGSILQQALQALHG